MRIGVLSCLDYGIAAQGACFDPATLTAVSLGATAIGGAASAAGTLAGGSYAATAGKMQQAGKEFEAGQLESNATQAIASSQRAMFDTQARTRAAISASTARAAGSGVAADVGSPVANVGELAARGSYQAVMDMFRGQSAATGLRNQAAGARYTGAVEAAGGEMAEDASYLAAAGTLAGSVGQGASTYGKYAYPQYFRGS